MVALAVRFFWNGKSLEEYDVHVLREQVAYIFQKAVMFPGSAEENIKMGAQFEHNVTQQELEGRFVKAIREAGITPEMLSVEAADLSGGQQQRGRDCRRTLMLDPVVLLFDEPTASLDVETSNKFCKTLKVLKSI